MKAKTLKVLMTMLKWLLSLAPQFFHKLYEVIFGGKDKKTEGDK